VRRALARAEELRRGGRHQEAVDLLLEALRCGEDVAQVFFRLGNIFFDRGDLARAEHAYRRATEEDARHSSAHHNLGVVYRRQGRIAQSVKMLKKARSLDFRHPRGVAGSPVERGVRRWLRPTTIVPLAIIGLVILIVWLVTRTG